MKIAFLTSEYPNEKTGNVAESEQVEKILHLVFCDKDIK